jgi:hypothetical protein
MGARVLRDRSMRGKAVFGVVDGGALKLEATRNETAEK